jgi:hypothetical protein
VHGTSLEEISYPGAAEPLRDVWLAVRSSLSAVLASVTLADLARGNLPPAVQALAGQPYPPTKAPSPEAQGSAGPLSGQVPAAHRFDPRQEISGHGIARPCPR